MTTKEHIQLCINPLIYFSLNANILNYNENTKIYNLMVLDKVEVILFHFLANSNLKHVISQIISAFQKYIDL